MPPSNTRVYAGLSSRDLKSVPFSALAPLSHRQADVLGWIAAGKCNDEIATILVISRGTFETQVQKIFSGSQLQSVGISP